jgi:hypothetical protein
VTDNEDPKDGPPDEEDPQSGKPKPRFRIDPAMLRAIEEQRKMFRRAQLQAGPTYAEVMRRAAEAVRPALQAYDSIVKSAAAGIIEQLRPIVESAAAATNALSKIDWPALLEVMRTALPPNWDENVDLETIESILNDEGIPLVFVPNNAILNQLLTADDRAARMSILLAARDEVLADCAAVLAEVTHSSLSAQVPLAKAAVGACQDGHYASGQALAVTVVETMVRNILGMNYTQAKTQLVLNIDNLAHTDVRVKAALAPIPIFYTPWHPGSGVPAPSELSRHVTVHQADVQHYTEENSLIAAMLVTSVMKAVDEYQHDPNPEVST